MAWGILKVGFTILNNYKKRFCQKEEFYVLKTIEIKETLIA